MQIPTTSSDASVETLWLTIPDSNLTFAEARDKAKEAALQHCSTQPMLLSWNDTIQGKYYPTFECGKTKDPPWIVYARARGANLTVDINQGDYVFMFLKL
jgi:hypothetical protein